MLLDEMTLDSRERPVRPVNSTCTTRTKVLGSSTLSLNSGVFKPIATAVSKTKCSLPAQTLVKDLSVVKSSLKFKCRTVILCPHCNKSVRDI